MTENEEYILEDINFKLWSGFYYPDDVLTSLSYLLEEGDDEDMLRKATVEEFTKKLEAEKDWPIKTDFDRLDNVYKALKEKGVICLHNAGYTMSDGHSDANEEIKEYPKGTFFGYCFYHRQDLERAMKGDGLMLAYDHVDGDVPDKIKIANALKEELEKAGFVLEWDGTTDQRINIASIDWKKRT